MNLIKKILGWLLYYIPIILYYSFGIFIVILLSIVNENSWPFTVIFIFITLIYFRKDLFKLFSDINSFKIGKDGIELKRITNEAKDTIEELKKIALVFSINLSKMATKVGRWGGGFSIEELSEFKDDISKLLKQMNITEKDVNKTIQSVNNYILHDILNIITEKYNGTPKVDISKDVHKIIGNPALNDYNPNIEEIEKYLEKKQELDDKNIEILQEAKIFKKTNYF